MPVADCKPEVHHDVPSCLSSVTGIKRKLLTSHSCMSFSYSRVTCPVVMQAECIARLTLQTIFFGQGAA